MESRKCQWRIQRRRIKHANPRRRSNGSKERPKYNRCGQGKRRGQNMLCMWEVGPYGQKLLEKTQEEGSRDAVTLLENFLWKCNIGITNFIWPYLHQFFDYSHSLNDYKKPLKRPFNQYQSHLKGISIG